ncbi:metallophosphoesterase [Oceaniglobus ichthyenteri]|uniref:metallophosphoesterase n=1 Tax=Oceaniglobus ichthyenteri TaxID=2136177 RepID=UPI000D378BCB|nr:metallophosphoesterase [Oceaniglobus ichthyenteri]
MKQFFARFWHKGKGKSAAPPLAVFDAPCRPEHPFAVVGDIHGRADLLEQVGMLIDDLPSDVPLICVGDYIDRGDESRAVLEMLSDPDVSASRDLICLMGNHEAMCLDFLDNPTKAGRAWIRYGGLQTLASFGVSGVGPGSGPADFAKARDALALAMGDRLIDWMRALPLSWHSGNISVVHAAADPGLELSDQPEKTLLWGHPEFTRRNRTDGQWIIHGHTIVDQPAIESGRISIDTGAYATNRLTVAIIREDGVEFRQTGNCDV